MININDNFVIINLKEYNILDIATKEEIKKNIDKNIFWISFKDNNKQNIKLLKKLKKEINIKRKNENRKKNFGIEFNQYKLIGIIENENEEIISCIRAIFIEDKDERYEYIYDTICKQLDKKWIEENPCKFESNYCIYERNNKNPREDGCCYAFWYKNMGTQTYGVHKCEHLHPTEHCKNSNLTCKLFVCTYLRKYSNFKIKINELILVQVFFNRYQKIMIRNNFFIEKKLFLEKLKKDEYRIKPLILYYVHRDFLVYKNIPKNKKEIAKRYEKIYKNTNGLRKKS